MSYFRHDNEILRFEQIIETEVLFHPAEAH